MRLLVFSAGGYGSMLQATYIIRKYRSKFDELVLMDDFLDPDELLRRYLHILEVLIIGNYNTPADYVVPSFNIDCLIRHHIRRFDKTPFDFNNKLNMDRFFDGCLDISKLVIPSHIYPYPTDKQLVFKPASGSGSKGITYFVPGDSIPKLNYPVICQETCPGPELIVDCVAANNCIHFTMRKSLERQNGRDTHISFDCNFKDYSDVQEILYELNVHRWEGAFNIQLRKHNEVWKVMEIDMRFSGSSIINHAYNELLRVYMNEVRVPSFNYTCINTKRFNYIKGELNEQAAFIYNDCKLPLPSLF